MGPFPFLSRDIFMVTKERIFKFLQTTVAWLSTPLTYGLGWICCHKLLEWRHLSQRMTHLSWHWKRFLSFTFSRLCTYCLFWWSRGKCWKLLNHHKYIFFFTAFHFSAFHYLYLTSMNLVALCGIDLLLSVFCMFVPTYV